jgi:MFS transporter, SP family, arabinose:H+ symporter
MTRYFPIVVDKFPRSTPFAFFVVMMAQTVFLGLFIFPETKAKSLEQIQAQFATQ